MIVEYLDLPLTKNYPKSVIGLGYFDGVHIGHEQLISNVIELSKSKKIKSSVFTFDIPIRKLFNKDFYGEITPLSHKLEIFESLGIDICYVLRFNKDIAALSKEEFINDILDKLNIDSIVCGSDYHFGYKASGDINLLSSKYNVRVVDFVNENGLKVSSSSIILSIIDGNIELVNKLLNKSYCIIGNVIHGLGNGHKIGIPTANIDYNGYVLPKYGVYKVDVIIDDIKYNGICNVGLHPSIDKLDKPSVEVYIPTLNKNIYDKSIKVNFIKYIREEIKFDNVDDLINQIKIDLNK